MFAVIKTIQFNSVARHVWLCDLMDWSMPDPASITNSRSLLKLMSIESVMPSHHLILCCLLLLPPSLFPSIRVFYSESVLNIRWPNAGASASASVLPMNVQDWFPLGWTGWISLLFKGLLRVFSDTTVQKHQFSFPDSSVAHASHVRFKPPASPVISAATPSQIHPRFHPWWMSPTGLLLGWYWVTQRRRFRSSKEKPSHCDQHQWGILTSPCSEDDDEWLKITSSEQSKLFFFFLEGFNKFQKQFLS